MTRLERISIQQKNFDVIEKDTKRLTEISGITEEIADNIYNAHLKQHKLLPVIRFLAPYGVSPKFAKEIYERYGKDEWKETVTKNPYRLYLDIKGIGFKTADDFAMKIGVPQDSVYRVQAGIRYVLEKAENMNGDCFLPKDDLEKAASRELSVYVGESLYRSAEDGLAKERKIVIEGDRYYRSETYYDEKRTAQKIVKLEKARGFHSRRTSRDVEEAIDELKKESGTNYNEEQIQAIRNSVTKNVSILTGGPGTGKTTALKGMIEAHRMLYPGVDIYLAAPTGKAAKRMSEQTGMEASTIHRLLSYDPMKNGFRYNEYYTLPKALFIIDESSMIGIKLMRSLISAIEDGSSVVFVGDIDQLPSISCGNVLRDLISVEADATVRLFRNYRQEGGSQIIDAAVRVNHGMLPDLNPAQERDFHYVAPLNDPFSGFDENAGMFRKLIYECSKAYKNGEDFQVLCPMKKWDYGTVYINQAVQQAVNSYGKVCAVRGKKGSDGYTEYRAGDQVIQTKNNYRLGVVNGETGRVIESEDDSETGKSIRIAFSGHQGETVYPVKLLDDLELGYAITVHKSQGSEFLKVFIFFTASQTFMMQRNLIYTAITRASGECFIYGPQETLLKGIRKNPAIRRNTALAERICKEREGQTEDKSRTA